MYTTKSIQFVFNKELTTLIVQFSKFKELDYAIATHSTILYYQIYIYIRTHLSVVKSSVLLVHKAFMGLDYNICLTHKICGYGSDVRGSSSENQLG